MFPDWSENLRHLYWRLRAARPASRPTVRTWQRRIQKEKTRLIAAGICPFQLHAVCRALRRPRCEVAFERMRRVVQRAQSEATVEGANLT